MTYRLSISFCYTQKMNAIRKFPELPYKKYDELFGKSIEQEKRGEGTECKTPQEIASHFAALRERIDAKYQTS